MSEKPSKTKNYKSWIAFMVFLGAYMHSVWFTKEEPIIYTTGIFLILVTFGIMLRSEQLMELLKILIERFKK